jgi:hypothetical protein
MLLEEAETTSVLCYFPRSGDGGLNKTNINIKKSIWLIENYLLLLLNLYNNSNLKTFKLNFT